MKINEDKIAELIANAIMESGALISPLERAAAKGDELFGVISKDKRLARMFFQDADIIANATVAFNANTGLTREFREKVNRISNKAQGIQITEEMIDAAIEDAINEAAFMPITRLLFNKGKNLVKGGKDFVNGVKGMYNYRGNGNFIDNYKQGISDAEISKQYNGTWSERGLKSNYMKVEKDYGGPNKSIMQQILKNLISNPIDPLILVQLKAACNI